MRKSVLLVALVVLFALTSCAGMDPQHQQNMVTNAAVWGGIGAATGCILSEATGGRCKKGAALGGLAGAYLGAGNTPIPAQYGYPALYQQGSVYEREKYRRTEQLRAKEFREWKKNEKRRAWNDAEREYYGE